MKTRHETRIACNTANPKFIGVEYDNILKHLNYWRYPYTLKDWSGFLGQWIVKYKYEN